MLSRTKNLGFVGFVLALLTAMLVSFSSVAIADDEDFSNGGASPSPTQACSERGNGNAYGCRPTQTPTPTPTESEPSPSPTDTPTDPELLDPATPTSTTTASPTVSATPTTAPSVPVPSTAPTAASSVTPSTSATKQDKTLQLRVPFAMDSSKLTTASISALKKLVKEIPASAESIVVTVEGYVQNTPGSKNNLELSIARAKAVVAQLKKLGLKAEYEFSGKGVLDKTAAARQAVITIEFKY